MRPALPVRTLLPFLAVLGLGCSGGRGTQEHNVLPQAPVSVLVGGSVSLDDRVEALYWKDGNPVPLESTAGVRAGVSAMAVSGSDVYAVGGHSALVEAGALWKNGVLTMIRPPSPSPAPSLSDSVSLTGIAVSGADVHISGTAFGNSPFSLAVHWKNGDGVALGGGAVNSMANGISIKGTDVFVAGWDGGARYWKNGAAFGLGSATGTGDVSAVAVTDAGDVLAAGYTLTPAGVQVATLWRNGEPSALSDGVKSACALALAVAGPDVYAAGYVVEGGTWVAAFWKNGVQGALPASKGRDSAVFGIAPYGTDVYAVGSDAGNAVLWKNGVETLLSDGRHQARATSICLVHP